MELRNFVIDRVLRGVMFHATTGDVLFSLSQITNPQLSVTADTVDAVDALGTPIMTFNRGKQAELSAESSLFDLGLLAVQSGTTLDVSSAVNTFTVPWFDEIKSTSADTVTLTRTPASNTLKYVWAMNNDGSLGTKFVVGTDVTLAGKVLTWGSGELAVGTRVFAPYEFTASNTAGSGATRVNADAVNFPTGGKFILEVLGCDVCDPSTLYNAYIVFPNAKMLSDFDITFATDSTHPFTIRANQDYCDPDKLLFRVVIPEAAAAA